MVQIRVKLAIEPVSAFPAGRGGGGGRGPGARSPENVLKKIVQFGAF